MCVHTQMSDVPNATYMCVHKMNRLLAIMNLLKNASVVSMQSGLLQYKHALQYTTHTHIHTIITRRTTKWIGGSPVSISGVASMGDM